MLTGKYIVYIYIYCVCRCVNALILYIYIYIYTYIYIYSLNRERFNVGVSVGMTGYKNALSTSAFSKKTSKLEKQDIRDTAGEVRTNP